MNEADKAFVKYLRSQVLPVKASQYDISSICNLRCEGCLFFSGDEHKAHPATIDLVAVDTFFAVEKRRGVNYIYLAGAEPSLAEKKLAIAWKHIPRGMIATNGIKKISREIGYRIHVSLWGLPADSERLRGANVVAKQLKNYRDDPRAVFVFVVSHANVEDIPAVVALCVDAGVTLTFNHYSPTTTYNAEIKHAAERNLYFRFSDSETNLLLTAADLARSRDLIDAAMEKHPATVAYNAEFNAWIHGPDFHQLDEAGTAVNCPSLTGGHFKHFNADLTESKLKCCSPNIDCRTCRLYIQSIATALALPLRSAEQYQWLAFWRLWCSLYLSHQEQYLQKAAA